jgi:acetylxylan esterase
MKAVISTLTLIAATAVAQERCDAEDPIVYCNTTEILAYQSSDCKPYHLFIVRGSDEPYPGRQGNISSQLCASLGNDQCGFESIEYPAKSTAWGKEEWCKSAGKGASDGQAQVKAYSQKCPDSKLMIFGYSQGGSVAQDILGGGGGHTFECDQATNPALDTSIGDRCKSQPQLLNFSYTNSSQSRCSSDLRRCSSITKPKLYYR